MAGRKRAHFVMLTLRLIFVTTTLSAIQEEMTSLDLTEFAIEIETACTMANLSSAIAKQNLLADNNYCIGGQSIPL